MKKYLWIFLILVLIGGIAFFVFNKSNNKDDVYNAERTSMSNQNLEVEGWRLENDSQANNQKKNVEEELASFSTRLPNDTEARDDNIKLACSTLNGTEVKSGETFSLWDVLGCPTKEKGYEKAKTFTADGEVTKSYGGGICQLSTTIYNAVLKVDGLKVTERHEHSRDVPYIEDGKDASVSYDTSDLKFKNTLDYDVKIEAEVEDREVKIKLIKIHE